MFPDLEAGNMTSPAHGAWGMRDEAQKLYADVLSVFQRVMEELRPGESCQSYQELACQLFQSQGHPTLQEAPHTTDGYVHSLGHGVGLYLHERPFFRLGSSQGQLLKPDSIVTVEPGLYYPERGMGVRLEDTCWIRPEGGAEILAPYPLDLYRWRKSRF
jgi:Xaa-Pro aminopeptidase